MFDFPDFGEDDLFIVVEEVSTSHEKGVAFLSHLLEAYCTSIVDYRENKNKEIG